MSEQTNTTGKWRLIHNPRGKGGRIVGDRNKTVCFLPVIGRNGSADAALILEAQTLQARCDTLQAENAALLTERSNWQFDRIRVEQLEGKLEEQEIAAHPQRYEQPPHAYAY